MNLLEKARMDATRATAAASPRVELKKERDAGLWMTQVKGPAHEEFHLTLKALPNEEPGEIVRRLATVLREKNATVVRHEIFGSNAAHRETMEILRQEIPDFDWPVMWIGNGDNVGSTISGMHVFAVGGIEVDTIYQNGEPIGRVFDDGQTRHCLLSNLKPAGFSSPKPVQSREVFRHLEDGLGKAAMDMTDVARTWFFLDSIQSWYGEFNDVRNQFFKERKLLDKLLPASTGVGSHHPACGALAAGAWALQAADGSLSVSEVPSLLQRSSMEYGSAFSRAVLVNEPACKRLLISGTASISPDGHSMYIGDVRKQIALTMEVVQAILASRRFEFPDVTRATAYFKDVENTRIFDEWRKEHNLEFLPLIEVQADICRPELLFEIEVDAIQVNPCCLQRDTWKCNVDPV